MIPDFGVVGRCSLFVIRCSEPGELPPPLLRNLTFASMNLFVRRLLVACLLPPVCKVPPSPLAIGII